MKTEDHKPNEMSKRIHDCRKRRKMTMEQLALMIGVNKSSISKWENGDVENINRVYIARMAQLFEVRPSWLMDMEDADVSITYESPGKKPLTVKVDPESSPVIGNTALISQLYSAILKVKPENYALALDILKSLS